MWCEKGLITAAITLGTYLLISRFGVFQVGDFTLALNGEGMAMLAGTITMIVFAVKNKTDAAQTGLTNIFSTNIDAIKSTGSCSASPAVCWPAQPVSVS